jgi:hypothetical protein
MSIADRVKETIDIKHQEFDSDDEFQKLSEFYKQMQQAGIARKQTYSLPLPDTVGRRLYQITINNVQEQS